MTAPLIENTVDEPPPLRRAVVGVLLGLVVGALAAAAIPRERGRSTVARPPGA